jgi:outer membrane protein assembly factor BamB
VSGDALFAVSVDGELAAFSRENGGVYWVIQLRRYEEEDDREGRVSWTGPILVGGNLVLVNSLGEIVAVAPENGTVVNRGDVDDPVFIPPITANGTIYVVTDKARLIAYR